VPIAKVPPALHRCPQTVGDGDHVVHAAHAVEQHSQRQVDRLRDQLSITADVIVVTSARVV
jgi:hypothetical protein